MQRGNLTGILQPLGAGIGAGAALGFVNRAAHVSEWGLGLLCVATGLLAAWSALRLVSVSGAFWNSFSTSILTGALLLSATYLEGRSLWIGAAWLAAAGAAGALALDVAAARGATSLRLPQLLCLFALCGGVALARYSPWSAAILGVAAVLPTLALVLERADDGNRAGLVWGGSR